ncbi:MAG: hypothetical protein EBX35_06445 [Planctomycetia bacterium]|nr:hypothetical protein [Planctomycetia bacterium]
MVEEFELARSAGHEQLDHGLGSAGEVGRPGGGCRCRLPQGPGQQPGQGDLAHADPAVGEEVPPGDVEWMVHAVTS